MLKKALRNFTEREINLVYKKGNTCFGRYCLLKFFGKKGKKKVIIVVSTKVSKAAVKRNRLRRQYYDILQDMWEELPEGYLLFSCKPKCETLSTKEIKTDLLTIINKCHKTIKSQE